MCLCTCNLNHLLRVFVPVAISNFLFCSLQMWHLILQLQCLFRVFNDNIVPLMFCNQLSPSSAMVVHPAKQMLHHFTLMYARSDLIAVWLFWMQNIVCLLGIQSLLNQITASKYHCDAILENETLNINGAASCQYEQNSSNDSNCLNAPPNDLHFRISVIFLNKCAFLK